MTDLFFNAPPAAPLHTRKYPEGSGDHSDPAPFGAGDEDPPHIRKAPGIVRFIDKLALGTKLEINTEIESRNTERAKKRWQWHRCPQGDEPVEDDEPLLTISEDDLDRLSDPVFSNTPMPFSLKEQILSRKRHRESDTGVKNCYSADGLSDRCRSIDGSFLKHITCQDFADIWIPQIFYGTADLLIYIPLQFFESSALLHFQRHELEILHDSKTINNLPILDAKGLTGALGGIDEGHTSFTYERFMDASANFLRFQASRDRLGDLGDWAKNWVLHFRFFSNQPDASSTFPFWKMDEIRLRYETCRRKRAFNTSVYEKVYHLAQSSVGSLCPSNIHPPPSNFPSSLSKNELDNKNSEIERNQSLGKVNLLPPLDESPGQGPDKEATISVATESEEAKHDNLQAPDQVPTNANGFFNGAHDLILYQPVMNSINEAKEQVFQWLARFTMSGAEFDASGHVPGCHPGTRITILEKLKDQIGDFQSTYRIVWLRGPAGVGKSAILQSLAEQLSETSNLGATLFFSRPNGRHNPELVIPTIAYQLAVRIPTYKEYVKRIMADNPKVLEKDMERQFQTLIVEPFTKLPLIADGSGWAILMDGLDECEGENSQVLVVNLISRFTRDHPTAPLVWVIASRPEAHLQAVFNSEGVSGSFGEHEVLADSDDACRDVEMFLRTKFGEIRENYKDLIPTDGPWPAEQDIARISRTSSGLFALATTIAHYVGDPDVGNPISQLAAVLSKTEGLEPGTLSTLYTMYSTILDGVPKSLSPILKLLLPFYTTQHQLTSEEKCPLVIFATIFGLQQHAVYGALRKLHAVIKVPPLSESGHLGIEFYHASFSDYLKTLEEYTIGVDMVRKCWWGLFAIVHGGNSITYRSATSDGGLPVPLSWDVKLHGPVLGSLWWFGIRFLLHHLSPRDPDPFLFGHVYLFSDAKELQSALEEIDFSALIFGRSNKKSTMGNLLSLFKQLLSDIPAQLSQSGVVTKTSIKNLDLACISKEKFSYWLTWDYWNGNRFLLDLDTYTTQTPPENADWSPIDELTLTREINSWMCPMDELISGLGKLQSENPMMDVFLVGKRPSKSCALIPIEATAEEDGSLYYISYCG